MLNSTHIHSYLYDGLIIEVYKNHEFLQFKTMLDDFEALIYEVKISDLKNDPCINAEIKNEILAHLKIDFD